MIVIDRLMTSLCLAGVVLASFVVVLHAQSVAAQDPTRLEADAKPEPVSVQQPVSIKPVKPKQEMGPPDPSMLMAEGVKGGAPAQPAAPQPTVQLKPGEVPAITFDTPEFNFGKIPAGQDITHDFWFTNTGTGPLEILSVKPS
jgi:hypothetical protein